MTSSALDRLPATAIPSAWTPQQSALMEFAGVSKTIGQGDDRRIVVPNPAVAEAFIQVCRRTGLDPFAKQIYMMEVGGKQLIVVGVDGFRVVAQRSEGYRGQIGPQWTADGINWVDAWLPDLMGLPHRTAPDGKDLGPARPAAARIGILRKGFKEPLWQVVTWAEFGVEPRFDKDNWGIRPAHMLGIRAETHGLRRTFPNDLSGLYTPEDFDDQDETDYAEEIKAEIKAIEAIKDEGELRRKYHELNSVGMPDSVRAAIMAHAGVLTGATPTESKPTEAEPSESGEISASASESPSEPPKPSTGRTAPQTEETEE